MSPEIKPDTVFESHRHEENLVTVPGNEQNTTDTLIMVVEILIDTDYYLIDSDLITRVIRPISGKPLYNAPPFITGIGEYDGDYITLVDIARLMGFESNVDLSRKRTLIIPAGSISEYAMAITVDHVCGIRTIRNSDVKPVDFSVIERLQGYVKGVVRTSAYVDRTRKRTMSNEMSKKGERTLIFLDIRGILTDLLAGKLRRPMEGFFYWGSQ